MLLWFGFGLLLLDVLIVLFTSFSFVCTYFVSIVWFDCCY